MVVLVAHGHGRQRLGLEVGLDLGRGQRRVTTPPLNSPLAKAVVPPPNLFSAAFWGVLSPSGRCGVPRCAAKWRLQTLNLRFGFVFFSFSTPPTAGQRAPTNARCSPPPPF